MLLTVPFVRHSLGVISGVLPPHLTDVITHTLLLGNGLSSPWNDPGHLPARQAFVQRAFLPDFALQGAPSATLLWRSGKNCGSSPGHLRLLPLETHGAALEVAPRDGEEARAPSEEEFRGYPERRHLSRGRL